VVMQAATSGSTVGLEVRALKKAKQPVPDEMFVKLVVDHISNSATCKQKGWVLDGFPSTPLQVELFKAAEMKIDKVVLLDVPDQQLEADGKSRRLDPQTGALHRTNDPNNPVPEDVAARLRSLPGQSEEELLDMIQKYRALEAALNQCFAKKVSKLKCRGDADATNTAVMAELYGAVIKKEKVAKAAAWVRPCRADASGKPYRLLITGAPGCGKGKICERLHREMGVAHLSHASLHNQLQNLDNELFEEAQASIAQVGSLSAEMTIRILQKINAEGDCAKYGWLLDGFPRNVAQATVLKESGLEISNFVNIQLPVEVLVQKLCNPDNPISMSAQVVKQRAEAHYNEMAEVVALFKVEEMKIEGSGEFDLDEMYASIHGHLTGKLIG